jgi:putative transposase
MSVLTAHYLDYLIFRLSDGAYIPSMKACQSAQQKLAILQRQLSMNVKFSNNWRKLLKRIQKLHWHIANIREDYLHKSSCALSKNHAIVYPRKRGGPTLL